MHHSVSLLHKTKIYYLNNNNGCNLCFCVHIFLCLINWWGLFSPQRIGKGTNFHYYFVLGQHKFTCIQSTGGATHAIIKNILLSWTTYHVFTSWPSHFPDSRAQLSRCLFLGILHKESCYQQLEGFTAYMCTVCAVCYFFASVRQFKSHRTVAQRSLWVTDYMLPGIPHSNKSRDTSRLELTHLKHLYIWAV